MNFSKSKQYSITTLLKLNKECFYYSSDTFYKYQKPEQINMI